MKNCKHKKGGKCILINVFVDDRGCAKCDGNPKMPKINKVKTPKLATPLERYYKTCKHICIACGDDQIIGLCPLGKMPC